MISGGVETELEAEATEEEVKCGMGATEGAEDDAVEDSTVVEDDVSDFFDD